MTSRESAVVSREQSVWIPGLRAHIEPPRVMRKFAAASAFSGSHFSQRRRETGHPHERLSENFFDSAYKRLQQRLIVDLGDAVQFLQQLALALVQFRGDLDVNFHVQITFAVAVEHGHTFVANAEGRSRLRAFGNLERVLAIHGGNAHIGSDGGLSDRNGDDTMQVVSFANEEGMLFYVQHDVQVAGRTSEGTDLAASGKTNARAIFHACGNFGVDRALAQNAAIALAFGARIGDDAARALTGGTGAGDAEKSLLVTNLAAPSAGTADGWSFAGGGARAATLLAGFVAANYDLSFGSEECLFEFDGEIFAQVGAALYTGAAASSSAGATKEVAKSEEVAEDIAEILEDRGIEAWEAPPPPRPAWPKRS